MHRSASPVPAHSVPLFCQPLVASILCEAAEALLLGWLLNPGLGTLRTVAGENRGGSAQHATGGGGGGDGGLYW